MMYPDEKLTYKKGDIVRVDFTSMCIEDDELTSEHVTGTAVVTSLNGTVSLYEVYSGDKSQTYWINDDDILGYAEEPDNEDEVTVNPDDGSITAKFNVDTTALSDFLEAAINLLDNVDEDDDTDDDFENHIMDITGELIDTLVAKNADYGNSLHKQVERDGLMPVIYRLEEKVDRLRALTKSDEQHVADESIVDTLKDLAGYAILALNELEDK